MLVVLDIALVISIQTPFFNFKFIIFKLIKIMETLFNEPKMRLKDGRYCSDEQKRIEMSIERCKLLEMQLQTERRKVIALTERNVQLEKKYNELKRKIKELC